VIRSDTITVPPASAPTSVALFVDCHAGEIAVGGGFNVAVPTNLLGSYPVFDGTPWGVEILAAPPRSGAGLKRVRARARTPTFGTAPGRCGLEGVGGRAERRLRVRQAPFARAYGNEGRPARNRGRSKKRGRPCDDQSHPTPPACGRPQPLEIAVSALGLREIGDHRPWHRLLGTLRIAGVAFHVDAIAVERSARHGQRAMAAGQQTAFPTAAAGLGTEDGFSEIRLPGSDGREHDYVIFIYPYDR
jgi:hypothetical protein